MRVGTRIPGQAREQRLGSLSISFAVVLILRDRADVASIQEATLRLQGGSDVADGIDDNWLILLRILLRVF